MKEVFANVGVMYSTAFLTFLLLHHQGTDGHLFCLFKDIWRKTFYNFLWQSLLVYSI